MLAAATGERDPASGMRTIAASLIDETMIPTPPFDPVVLASFQNVSDVRLRTMDSAARLVPDAATNTLIIEVNAEHSLGKRNFSINHETGHTLLPTYKGALIDDSVTGQFLQGSEEEFLCDVGAAALLLDTRWLRPLAAEAGPSIQTLFELAKLFEASIEATARQIAELDLWPCAFVFWEDGLRKDQRVPAGQMSMSLLETYGTPQTELRVSRRYKTRSFGMFIPQNKSIERTSLVATCCDSDQATHGWETFEFERNRPESLYCENCYVPYRSGGIIHRRVVSLLLRSKNNSHVLPIPELFQLENL